MCFRYTSPIDIRTLHSPADLNAYDAWIGRRPAATLWQSLAWKDYQEAVGRSTRLYACFEGDTIVASALVCIDATAFGYCTWDLPRGPVWDKESAAHALMERIETDARTEKVLALFLSPLHILPRPGAARSPRHEQPEATRVVDLSKDDETVLAQMHQKGRYNIKVAQKGGVTVRLSRDIDAYYDLMKGTGERDRFGIKPLAQYKAFLERIPESFLMLAYAQDNDEKPIAGLVGASYGTTGIYYYGASDYAHRALMAPYALQWEAMRHCRENGCLRYDLLGVAPEFGGKDHPWAGITSFKEKFGGAFVTYPPEQRIVLKPLVLKVLETKRRILG